MSIEFVPVHTSTLATITGGNGNQQPNGSVTGNVNANAAVSLDLNKPIGVLDQIHEAVVRPIRCAIGADDRREFANCWGTGQLGNVPPRNAPAAAAE
jgi:hypothetical protein